MMSPIQCFNAIQRRSAAIESRSLRDPLAATASLIAAEPATPRARVLVRILRALQTGSGGFSEIELWSLDSEANNLVTALVDDRLKGRYTESDFAAVLQALETGTDAHEP